jgi:hypothetical protein
MRGPAPAGPRQLLGATVLVVAALAACTQPAPPATATAPPTARSSSPPAPSLTPSLAPSPTPFTGVRAELPAEFPVPPDAVALPLPDATAVIGRWEVPGFGAPVYDFYLGALPAAGYPISAEAPGGDAAIIRFEAAPESSGSSR